MFLFYPKELKEINDKNDKEENQTMLGVLYLIGAAVVGLIIGLIVGMILFL